MVVLTIVTEGNGEAISFEKPIPQVHFIKLVSCSLYNSWDTLKREGSARLGDIQNREGVSVGKILPGHYDSESLAKAIHKLFVDRRVALQTEMNEPFGQLVIHNTTGKQIELDRDLAALLGIERKLPLKTVVKRITSSSTYFIHCDLLDKTQNLWNGERSDLLAVVNVKGKPYEKVTYHAYPQQASRECATDKFISSITISVKDENGGRFDFKGFPLVFELELI